MKASCWVLETVEMRSPRPSAGEQVEDARQRAERGQLPVERHAEPEQRDGRDQRQVEETDERERDRLAGDQLAGVSGLTMSCSRVPISRSRTTASAVRSRQMSSMIAPTTAGTL